MRGLRVCATAWRLAPGRSFPGLPRHVHHGIGNEWNLLLPHAPHFFVLQGKSPDCLSRAPDGGPTPRKYANILTTTYR